MKTKDTYLKAPLIKGDVWKTGGFWAYAFTLVELIVVITILAILWTIAFLSFQWYNRSARDSVRTSDIKNIEQWLWVMIAKSWIVPTPDDNKITLTASWTVIWYQWYAWKQVQNAIWMSANWWKDPIDLSYYTYSTNSNKTKYQLLGFLEWTISKSEILWKSYAIDYSNKFIITRWSEIWILLWNSWTTLNQPIQENGSWIIDLTKTTTSSWYILQFSNTETSKTIIWTSTYTGSLYSLFYNKNESLFLDKNLAKYDDSLVLYLDMETLTWTLLKDFSKYWNDCLWSNGVVFAWVDWKKWKSTNFYWTQNCNAGNTQSLSFNNNFSISSFIYPTWYHTIWYYSLKNMVLLRWPATTFNYAIQVNDNNSISFIKRTWVEWLDYYTFNNLPSMINKWSYITVNVLNNNIMLYIDWNFIKSISLRGIIAPWSNDYLNIWWTSWWVWTELEPFFYWIIDEVRIYNRALSDSEIQILYNATK
jgi:prepilin-type N-terminal cleavage/methylation domain-containing protein